MNHQGGTFNSMTLTGVARDKILRRKVHVNTLVRFDGFMLFTYTCFVFDLNYTLDLLTHIFFKK